jgi:hypothetical protein
MTAMIELKGGPVMDTRAVKLSRTPLYLRVVRSRAGIAQALDNLGCKPPWTTDTVHAYFRAERITDLFPDTSGEDGLTVTTWVYRYVKPQPSSEVMRSHEMWQQWCLEQVKEKSS